MTDLRLGSGLASWWEIVRDVLERVDGVVPWGAICEELGKQLDAPVTGHFRWTADGRGHVVAYPLPDWFDLPDVASRAARLHPLARHYAMTGATGPMSIDQVPALAEPAARDYAVELREDAIDQHLWIPVHHGPRDVLVAGVCRPTDSFSASDHARAVVAQKVIVAVHAHSSALAQRLPVALSAEQRDAALGEVKLTPRQVAVLALAADGLTAVSIGRRLVISPRTVERHLQNAYARMGVRDRITAVRRAEQAGLLRAHVGPVASRPPS